jgi:hypothetical protein
MPPAGVAGHGERLEAAQPRRHRGRRRARRAPRLRQGQSRPRRAHRLDRAHGRRRARGAARGAPALVRQLGDPSAQVSGALAGRAVVGVPADAAAVAHREGVLPGRKKRPKFRSKPVQVVHGLSHLRLRESRRRRLASRIERWRRARRYVRPDRVACTCGRPPCRRAPPQERGSDQQRGRRRARPRTRGVRPPWRRAPARSAGPLLPEVLGSRVAY